MISSILGIKKHAKSVLILNHLKVSVDIAEFAFFINIIFIFINEIQTDSGTGGSRPPVTGFY